MIDDVLAVHRRRLPGYLDQLAAFCRIPSVGGDDGAMDEAVRWLVGALRDAGSEAELLPGEGNHPYVVGTVRGAGPRALGASDARLLSRHVLPNTIAPVIVIATNALSGAILIEASLGFLGLGTQLPVPSWGNMLSEEARRYFEQAPWMALPPGIALSLTVLAVNFFGDALRDTLDPRLRRRQA